MLSEALLQWRRRPVVDGIVQSDVICPVWQFAGCVDITVLDIRLRGRTHAMICPCLPPNESVALPQETPLNVVVPTNAWT